MKTGTILLVSGTSKRAEIIQKFQKKEDPEAGKWNHSGIIFETELGIYVVEMAELEDRKVKAACRITPLYEYEIKRNLHEYDLLYLVPNFVFNETVFEEILLNHVGTPYDYDLLLRRIPGDILFNIEAYKKSSKRMTCHEMTMHIWHEYFTQCTPETIFPEWYKGKVMDIYHCDKFKHQTSL